MAEITTKQAVEKGYNWYTLNHHLRVTKRLPGRKLGRDWVFNEEDLKLILNLKRGRPKKQARHNAGKNTPTPGGQAVFIASENQ